MALPRLLPNRIEVLSSSVFSDSRFDFIFLNKGILPEVDQEKCYIHSHPNWFTASDHRPCVAKIKPVEKEAP